MEILKGFIPTCLRDLAMTVLDSLRKLHCGFTVKLSNNSTPRQTIILGEYCLYQC